MTIYGLNFVWVHQVLIYLIQRLIDYLVYLLTHADLFHLRARLTSA